MRTNTTNKGKDFKKIKGVVFDFNGTLFWDTQLHNKAWDIFLEGKDIRLTDLEKNEKIHGKNNKDILSNVFTVPLSNDDLLRLSIEKEQIYQNLCLKTDMKLATGAIEFLNFLKSNGIPYTIATASELFNVNFYFDQLGLDSFFDRSKVVYNDGTLPSKPHPLIFQRAIGILGTNNHEILIFEDSISGILAAENANAGKIIIVDSNNDDYGRWDYQKIKSFLEVDNDLFI